MDQAILNEVVRLPSKVHSLGVELLAVRQGGEIEASSKQEGEGVVIRPNARTKHLLVEAKGSDGLLAFDVGSDHGVPEEGRAVGEAPEHEIGVAEIAAVGDGAEVDELAGGIRIEDGAGDKEAAVDLFQLAHGEASPVEEGKGSLV